MSVNQRNIEESMSDNWAKINKNNKKEINAKDVIDIFEEIDTFT